MALDGNDETPWRLAGSSSARDWATSTTFLAATAPPPPIGSAALRPDEFGAAPAAKGNRKDAYGGLPAGAFAGYATATVFHTDPELATDNEGKAFNAEHDLGLSDAAHATVPVPAISDEPGRRAISALEPGHSSVRAEGSSCRDLIVDSAGKWMKLGTKRVRRLTFCKRLSLPVMLTALLVSCSDSKDDSGSSPDALYAEIRKQADPVAELTAGIVVGKLLSQGSEETNAEIRDKHGSKAQPFKDSLCAELEKAAKPADDDETDQVRTRASEAVRDSFVLKFVQAASAAPPERATEIAQAFDIESKGPDGSALAGSAALRDPLGSTPDGTLQIPAAGTMEHIEYTDWLMNNPAVAGLITSLTRDYEETVRDCAPG